MIKKWLEAGYLENDVFYRTRTGTPQGGIISPLLANIALHGMEEALNIKYRRRIKNNRCYYSNESKYVVIRYADDFVVLCKTLEDAKALYDLLDDYLNERGLTLASDKTRITNLYDGFDFWDIIYDAIEVKIVIRCLLKHLMTVSNLLCTRPKLSFAIATHGILKRVLLASTI